MFCHPTPDSDLDSGVLSKKDELESSLREWHAICRDREATLANKRAACETNRAEAQAAIAAADEADRALQGQTQVGGIFLSISKIKLMLSPLTATRRFSDGGS